MRFPLSEAEEAFRQHIRDFCATHLDKDLAARVRAGAELSCEDYTGWQRSLAKGGLLGGAWPQAHGGKGWSALQSYLFDEECALAGAPWLLPFGVNYVGPVISEFGTEAQRARFLPSILDASVFWCQGYSEPEAGSDLAALRTKARREGDEYIVTGRKIWTTMAQWADWIFCLVRTAADGKPQAGISFLLIDMKSPGISVRPIISIEGRHHLNEVVFDEVRVPVENRIGAENAGWTIAKFLLGNERLLVAEIGKQKRLLQAIRDAAQTAPAWLGPRLAELEARLLALEWTALRTVRAADAGGPDPAAVSLLKIRGSELEQALTECAAEVMGRDLLRYDPEVTDASDPKSGVVARMLAARATTIYGGSNEIQRSIIARQLMGA